jgi:hypothetical protein
VPALSIGGIPVDPLAMNVTHPEVIARLRQSVALAPSVPAASDHRSVGCIDVTTVPDNGAICRGAPITHTHVPPEGVHPALHVIPHAPDVHVATPPVIGAGHTLPHAPQLDTSLVVFTHAPLHAVKPALHAMPHAPALQTALPLEGGAHTEHVAPQWLVSVSAKQLDPHA